VTFIDEARLASIPLFFIIAVLLVLLTLKKYVIQWDKSSR